MAVPGLEGHIQEWPGSGPAKFTDKFTGLPLCRRIVNTECRNGDDYSIARQGLGQYFTDTAGLIPSETKKLIDLPPSQTYEWRPCKRSLSVPGQYHHEKPEGRRAVEQPVGKPYSIREKRHIRQVESKEEFIDRPVGPRAIYRENGLRAADQPAREVDIIGELQRKNRALDLHSQRNGIGCKALGDKNYRHPEYSTHFYKAGELVVGSGFSRGSYPKTEPRNSTNVQLVFSGERKKIRSFKQKEAVEQSVEAIMEVEDLTRDWESENLKKELGDKYQDPADSDEEDSGTIKMAQSTLGATQDEKWALKQTRAHDLRRQLEKKQELEEALKEQQS